MTSALQARARAERTGGASPRSRTYTVAVPGAGYTARVITANLIDCVADSGGAGTGGGPCVSVVTHGGGVLKYLSVDPITGADLWETFPAQAGDDIGIGATSINTAGLVADANGCIITVVW